MFKDMHLYICCINLSLLKCRTYPFFVFFFMKYPNGNNIVIGRQIKLNVFLKKGYDFTKKYQIRLKKIDCVHVTSSSKSCNCNMYKKKFYICITSETYCYQLIKMRHCKSMTVQ